MSPRRVLPKPAEDVGPKVSKKKSPRGCPEPTEAQLEAADQIVAGIPPAAAMAAIGVTHQTSTALKTGAMRTALRIAIEKELRARGGGSIDKAAARTLVEGLEAMRPVVVGREMMTYPDFTTRGSFLDRLLKLTGDMGRKDEEGDGGAWDALVLRMHHKQPVLGE